LSRPWARGRAWRIVWSAAAGTGYDTDAVTPQRAESLLVLLLRCGGVLLSLAFAAMFLPTSWMAASHGWLGLGEFPAGRLTDYLTRSISGLYGFHGVLLFVVASDPVRYERIVLYLGVMNMLFGVTLLAIDLHAAMPALWTAFEGPPLVMIGIVTIYLRNRIENRAK
jgi:hypothetical protein